MRRFTMLTICLLAVAGFMAMPAWAQSSGAHFQHGSVSAAIQSNGDLVVSWVEAGLGSTNVNYSVTGHFDAQYFCVTKSGSIPDATNKQTPSGDDTAGASFQPKNGKVTASLTLSAPAPASLQPTCGKGQSLSLQSITWSNVTLSDTSYLVDAAVTKGTFSITVFPAP